MAVIDLKELNTGSAVSQPGALSSTKLGAPPPILPSSNLTDLGGLSGSPAPWDSSAYAGIGANAPPTLASSGIDLSSLNNPVDVGTLNTGTPSANFPTDPTTGAPATATGDQGLLSSLGSTVGGLAPSLIAGGIGLSQAKGAQNQSAAFAAQLQALGGPYTAAGQALLKQWQSGQITPTQQNVVNTLNKQGQTLEDSAAPLSAIAQEAYQAYQSGTLPPADEQRLQEQVAAQKQQVAQQLASAGITDSTILAGHYAQIDNQATETRQQLLDARFATGNQAYDQWLTATTEGQQLKAEAAKFAATSLDTMLTQSLNLGAEGMAPITQAIQLQIQSDAALSAQVNQLMGNLAAAYAYQTTGGKPPGTAGAAGSIANLVSKGLGGGAPGGGGPSATDIANIENSGVDYGLGSTTQTAIDASAPGLDPNTISGLTSTTDTGTTDPNAGPSAAGGEAATVPSNPSGVDLSALGTAAGVAAGAIGIYSGLTSGKPLGDARAAVGAAKLAGQTGLVSPQVNAVAGNLGNILGIYSGLKQGGVAGDAGAAVNAAQLGSKLGAFGGASPAIGAAASYVAAPLALYNEVTTWKSGATASDALAGAETGAAVGSIIPGIGTAIGAVIGGALGALSSIFGGTDKTARSWTEYSYGQNRAETASNPAELMSTIGGLMRSPDKKFSGDVDFQGDGNKFTTSIASQVAAAVKKGTVPRNASPQQIFIQVVQPWLQNLPGGWTQTDSSDPNRARVANAEQNLVLDVINNYQQGKPITYGETVGQKPEYAYTPYSQLTGG
jgi:hypothetical protein